NASFDSGAERQNELRSFGERTVRIVYKGRRDRARSSRHRGSFDKVVAAAGLRNCHEQLTFQIERAAIHRGDIRRCRRDGQTAAKFKQVLGKSSGVGRTAARASDDEPRLMAMKFSD